MTILTRRIALAAAAAALASPKAWAFPSNPVRLIVPFGPGGFADLIARQLAEPLGQRLGQPVVVENRPGAGGNIAAEAVARAAPDGHTLLLAGQGLTSINPALYARLPFDPERDFAVIGFIAEVPNLALGGPATPGGSLAGLIAAAKASPGTLSYGSVGVGSVTHLAAEMLCAAAGIRMEHIPYRTPGAAQADLIAGRIHLLFESAGSAIGLIRGGQLRGLGVAGPQRLANVPQVSTIAEMLPGYEAIGWYGLLAPASVPGPALARLRTELAATITEPAFGNFLSARGAEPMRVTPDQGPAFLAADRRRWGDAVRSSGARAE
jgi:tripartite-type tricarboxylate transporter receptor subunit TctC